MARVLMLTVLAAALVITAGCANTVRVHEDFALTHDWRNFESLSVNVRNGSVEVRPADGQVVRVSGKKYASGATIEEARKNVDRLELVAGPADGHAGTYRVELRYPDELKNRNIGASVLIELPEAVAANIKTSNGAIKVARLAGAVRLETSNAAVHAREIDGPLTVDTSNGGIILQNVSGKVIAESSNGNVEARDLRGPCKLTSSNGNIVLSADPPAGSEIELRTSNGNIHATLPPTIAAELRADTSNGRVKVDLPEANLQNVKADRSSYHALLNGGGAKLIADTSNGSIRIDAR